MKRAVLFNAIAFCVFALGVTLFLTSSSSDSTQEPSPPAQLSAAEVSHATSTPVVAITVATSSATSTTSEPVTEPQPAKESQKQAIIPVSTSSGEKITRTENPYSTPPESFDQVNVDARAALVNILCEPQGASSLNPISGSGVLIDPRGIILTNAHVAQYVLLSEDPQVNLKCVIRTGSPAKPQWTASVLYIPPVWVNQHASEILEEHPTGSGEHDYALLYITGSASGSALPAQFPYVPIDTRPAIGFPGDQVLLASYPAELVGGIAAQYDLYADSSVATIQQLMTFNTSTPDVLSLGGVIEAQGGSSGGAVVNAWGRLIALIATTSGGTTTADRDLHAISLNYINNDLANTAGSLQAILAGSPDAEVQQFNADLAPALDQIYIQLLSSTGR